MIASGTQLCLPQSWHRYLCCPSTKFITTNYYQQISPQSLFFTTNYANATFGSSPDLHTDHLVHFFQIIITKMVSIKMVIKAALRKKLYYVGRIQNNQLDFLLLKCKVVVVFSFWHDRCTFGYQSHPWPSHQGQTFDNFAPNLLDNCKQDGVVCFAFCNCKKMYKTKSWGQSETIWQIVATYELCERSVCDIKS